MRSRWVIGAGIVAVTVLAFLPALQCGFVWDDDDHVTDNPTLRSMAGLLRIWLEPASLPQYYPLVHTTFWLEYRAWGLAPLGYHLVNVLLHAANAVLFWRLAARLALPGALLAAFVFAVHPVHVESVAWITERKNVLSLLFYLLAAHAWLRWRGGFDDAPRGGALGFAAIVALYVAALLSKTVTASLPAAMLLVVWWKAGRIPRRDVAATLPLFVIGGALAWFTIHLERTHVGAEGQAWDLSLAERILVAGRAPWFYVQKLVWPFDLAFVYPRWQVDASAAWQWLFPLGTCAAIASLWALRARIGRGPLVAVLFFGGTLVPALGFFDVYPFRYSFVADHFQYHASLGILALLACGAARLAGARIADARIRVALAAVPVAVLGVLTFRQCPVYRDLETLWRETLRGGARVQIAHNNLGKILLDRGELAPALVHLEAALALDEGWFETHLNLGVAHYQTGDAGAAERHFRRAVELRPDRAEGWNNLAFVLQRRGELRAAVASALRAVAAHPAHIPARATLAGALSELVGELPPPRAADAVAEACRPLGPWAAGMVFEAAERLAGEGRRAIAAAVAARAAELARAAGRSAEAARYARRAVELR